MKMIIENSFLFHPHSLPLFTHSILIISSMTKFHFSHILSFFLLQVYLDSGFKNPIANMSYPTCILVTHLPRSKIEQKISFKCSYLFTIFLSRRIEFFPLKRRNMFHSVNLDVSLTLLDLRRSVPGSCSMTDLLSSSS